MRRLSCRLKKNIIKTDNSLSYQGNDESDLGLDLERKIKQMEQEAGRQEFFLYVLLGFMLAWGCGLFLDDQSAPPSGWWPNGASGQVVNLQAWTG